MSTHKLFDTVCGFPEHLLISQTPMVCRLLLKTSGSISCKHPSVRKWMRSLSKLLQNSLTNTNAKNNQKKKKKKNKNKKENGNDDGDNVFLSFDDDKSSKNKKKETNDEVNVNGVWSSLCLISTSYRIITAGNSEWNKHSSLILESLEKAQIFYHPVLRTRCFETLCEIIEYSQCIHSSNSYQLSQQSSTALIRLLQNLLIEIVLNKNVSFNLGGRLLHNLLMTLYRLFANGKNLNRNSNISLITKACFYCLTSNDLKIRSTAIGILVLLCKDDKKCNELIDQTMHTLHYLLRDLFPSNVIPSNKQRKKELDKSECIEHIMNIIPSAVEADTFERISLFGNVMNGLVHLLNHFMRRKNKKSLNAVNSSSTTSVKTDNKNVNSKQSNIKIVSASCSMNNFNVRLPIKSILVWIMDIVSISMNDCLKHGHLMEYLALLNGLYQNALWTLVNSVATLQKSILPYANIIGHILLSIAKETRQKRSKMEYEIRCSLYRAMCHIIPILGPSVYDILYNELRIYLMNDLKAAQKILMSSPPNPASLSQKNKQKLITSTFSKKNYKPNMNGDGSAYYESPRKKQKISHYEEEATGQKNDGNIAASKGLQLQREYDSKLAFYGQVLKVISAFFNVCSNYMAFDEKSEIELILSSSLLGSCSDSGHILINLCCMDLFNEFISTMVSVLMAPKMYKKPYLSLTSKLLSSSFGIGTILSNYALINKSQTGMRYIESVINPRSIPVYNKPLTLVKDTRNSTNIDGNVGSLRKIRKWNEKIQQEIVNEQRFEDKNKKKLDNDNDDSEAEDEKMEEQNKDLSEQSPEALNGDFVVIEKERDESEYLPKTSLAEKLLNKKRTFSEMDNETSDKADEKEEENPVLNGGTNSFLDDGEEDESDDTNDSKDDMNKEEIIIGNDVDDDFKEEMQSMFENMSKNGIAKPDDELNDEDVEPLWSY